MDIQLIVPKDGAPATAMRIAGQVVTLAEFPPADTIRWVIGRKSILASAVMCGLKSAENLVGYYENLTLPELMGWVTTLRESGYAGLRQTHVQELSQSHMDESLPVPVEDFYIAEAEGLVLTSDGVMRSEGRPAIRFTKKEARLLGYLMLNPGIVVSKETFLRLLYPNGLQVGPKIVDVFICKIRKKLKGAFGKSLIETSWGRGYFIP